MPLLDEEIIKAVIDRERMFMEAIVDPMERKVAGAFIAGLECALND